MILSFCIIGTATSAFLGIQFMISRRERSDTNYFLGIFFLLISIRTGKLLVQELGSTGFQNIYFNIMHFSFLAMGPVIWLYVSSYLLNGKTDYNNKWIHLVPSLIILLLAFQVRQLLGETIWLFIFWFIQIHPLIYSISILRLLKYKWNITKVTKNQKVWLYGLPFSVIIIVGMNILYFILGFPFYLVTSSLLIITLYLIVSLALNNKLNILLGKSDKKYKNLHLSSEEIENIWVEIREFISVEKLYLNDQLKLSDVSGRLNKPVPVLSMVINTRSGKSFNDFINGFRIDQARKRLLMEKNEKIIVIAQESGFTSLSAFNRAFKRYTGQTPSEYRSIN